jgi:protein O-mannosyl-transferase
MSRPRNLLLAFGVFAATLLAYAPAIRGGFIWNDSDYVTAPALRSSDGLARIWFELGATEQYYPILHSAFWVEHRLWGDSPTGYHVLNILLHAGCACLLAAILRRLAMPGAWLAAFLFALHPVCVESVAWISEQKNTLSLLFYLLAALVYLRFDETRTPRAYALATALFVLGLLSKSTTATLPPALLVVFWWRRGRLDWRRDVVPLLPWLALGAAMGLFSAYVEKVYIGAQGSEFALSPLQRGLLAGRIAWFYLGKLIWPGELIFIYPRWDVNPAVAWQWVFGVAAMGLVAALWMWRRCTCAPLAAVLFFGGSLFPVLGFFNVYAFMFSFVADHWQYQPSIGIITLGAAALARLGSRGRLAAMLVAVAFGWLTFHQSGMYADMVTFYRTTVARNPGAWMAHNNLGNMLREAGQLEEAVRHFEAALRARPDLYKTHNNLAACLHDLKRPQEALQHYQRAIELAPDYPDAHNNLGRLLRELGRVDESIGHLTRALQIDPEYHDARNNLGMALRDAGRMNDAIAQFERLIRATPDSPQAHLNLALTYSLVGREADSMREYREARRLNPAIPELSER